MCAASANPAITPTANVTITAGGSVSFTGTGTDPDGHLPLTFRWTFGGGAPDSQAEDPGAVTFSTPGTYTVTFTVTDSLGAADPTPDSRVITVNAPPNGVIDSPATDVTITQGEISEVLPATSVAVAETKPEMLAGTRNVNSATPLASVYTTSQPRNSAALPRVAGAQSSLRKNS